MQGGKCPIQKALPFPICEKRGPSTVFMRRVSGGLQLQAPPAKPAAGRPISICASFVSSFLIVRLFRNDQVMVPPKCLQNQSRSFFHPCSCQPSSLFSSAANRACMVGLFLVSRLMDRSCALLLASLKLFSELSSASLVFCRCWMVLSISSIAS